MLPPSQVDEDLSRHMYMARPQRLVSCIGAVLYRYVLTLYEGHVLSSDLSLSDHANLTTRTMICHSPPRRRQLCVTKLPMLVPSNMIALTNLPDMHAPYARAQSYHLRPGIRSIALPYLRDWVFHCR